MAERSSTNVQLRHPSSRLRKWCFNTKIRRECPSRGVGSNSITESESQNKSDEESIPHAEKSFNTNGKARELRVDDNGLEKCIPRIKFRRNLTVRCKRGKSTKKQRVSLQRSAFSGTFKKPEKIKSRYFPALAPARPNLPAHRWKFCARSYRDRWYSSPSLPFQSTTTIPSCTISLFLPNYLTSI
jgi:hypothetical protein